MIIIVIANRARAIKNKNREDYDFIITSDITILKNEIDDVKKGF